MNSDDWQWIVNIWSNLFLGQILNCHLKLEQECKKFVENLLTESTKLIQETIEQKQRLFS